MNTNVLFIIIMNIVKTIILKLKVYLLLEKLNTEHEKVEISKSL